MMRWSLALALLGLLAGGAQAAEPALDLLDTPVPYSADFTLNGPRGSYSGHVWHAQGSERREVATQGGGQGILIQRDTGTAYFLGIGGRWYVTLSLDAASGLVGGLNSWQVERQRIGEETLGGQRVTRWTATASGPKGGFQGEIWTTRDDIVVRAVGTVSGGAGGTPGPVEMTLSHLQVGSVDQRMLEVPDGWFGIDLRQMPADRVVQAIEGMKPMLNRRAKSE